MTARFPEKYSLFENAYFSDLFVRAEPIQSNMLLNGYL